MSVKLSSVSALLLRAVGLIKAGCASALPCPCLLCGTENLAMICAPCQRQFFPASSANSASPANSARCLCCAIPLQHHDLRCGQCLADPPAFQRTWVACDYAAPLDQLVLSLKFGHQLAVAPALAPFIAASVLSNASSDTSCEHSLPDLLIPVPLSRARLAQRGFNQSLEIARPLARLLGLPLYPTLLSRVRDTAAQTLLHPDQRRQNLRHAFAPLGDDEDKIRDRHIGVVDDVITTGATLHEIAACLKRHGARRVSNLVFARTPPH